MPTKQAAISERFQLLFQSQKHLIYLDAPIRRCAGEDVPMPYAQNLENAMIPTVESIKDAIRKTYNKE